MVVEPKMQLSPYVSGPNPAFCRISGAPTLHGQVLLRPQQVGEGRQNMQAILVFLQSSIANLAVAKVTLDRQERVFDLRPNTGFESLDPVSDAGCGQVRPPSWAHRHLPVHRTIPVFFALIDPRVTGIRPDMAFFAVQQSIGNVQVVLVGGRGLDAEGQPQGIVHPDVHLHTKVPLVILADLVRLRIASILSVLGGARRFNDGGVDDRAILEHQIGIGQVTVDLLDDDLAETPAFQGFNAVSCFGIIYALTRLM